ncbi:hypothetical protein J2741_002518 [Methanolinea mesophila]|uniref:hypothetical protein n=1 Tax=Methanolinea mesophila TaxID=547055 RepID=UPI001AE23845|nr:hypothetical protein [Methanolinea mesophila]MBP1929922.1 hypothetical protein [Methanolinea mesophila]
MKFHYILIIAALSLLTGLALADSAVPQTEETQGFITSTIMQAVGTATERDSLAWQITNNGFIGGLTDIPPLFPEVVAVYSMAYNEDTIADQGLVTYAKQGSVDTQGKVPEQSNVNMEKVVEFVGLDTGRMTSAEEQVLDGAGTPFFSLETFICPFAAEQTLLLPAFCNIVQEGSSVDLTLGSLSTAADTRFVTALAPVGNQAPGWDRPVSDNGVESNYRVTLTGFGDVPAMGSADAFINVHIQEGRGLFGVDGAAPLNQEDRISFDPKAEDLTYSEDSTASGEITLFRKLVGYNSKLTGGPGVLPSL